MRIAQRLYEEGYITYMRTDSVNLSQDAINAAKDFIEKNLGQNILRQEITLRNLHLLKKRTKRFVRLILGENHW